MSAPERRSPLDPDTPRWVCPNQECAGDALMGERMVMLTWLPGPHTCTACGTALEREP